MHTKEYISIQVYLQRTSYQYLISARTVRKGSDMLSLIERIVTLISSHFHCLKYCKSPGIVHRQSW